MIRHIRACSGTLRRIVLITVISCATTSAGARLSAEQKSKDRSTTDASSSVASRSLDDAVQAVNDLVAKHSGAPDQPLLTEQAVLQTIGRVTKDDGLTSEEFSALKQVATNHRLPPNVILKPFLRYHEDTYMAHGLWVRLMVLRDDRGPATFNVIRRAEFGRHYTQLERFFRHQTRNGGLPLINRLVVWFDDDPKFGEQQSFDDDRAEQLGNAVVKAIDGNKPDEFLDLFHWDGIGNRDRSQTRAEVERFCKREIRIMTINRRRFGGRLTHWQGFATYKPNLPVLGTVHLSFQDKAGPQYAALEFGQTADGALRLVNYVVDNQELKPGDKLPALSLSGYSTMHPEHGWLESIAKIDAPDSVPAMQQANLEIRRIRLQTLAD